MQKTGLGLTMIVAIALLSGLAADSAAASKQELIVNRKAEGVSLDPAKTTAMEDYAVMANLYSSLFRFKPNSFELRPATALRTLSPSLSIANWLAPPSATSVPPFRTNAVSAATPSAPMPLRYSGG